MTLSSPSDPGFSWERLSLDAETEMFVLRGDLDAGSAPALRVEIRRLFEDGGRHFVLFDLTAVSFVDSLGLGVFFVGHRLAQRSGGLAAVACPPPRVRQTMAASGLARTMYVAPTRADAIVFLSRAAHGHPLSLEEAEGGVLD